MSSIPQTWAQLVSTTENESEPIEIEKNKFIIGRSKAADICLLNNKLVSGSHCFIEKDDSGEVWLHDTSTNGTLLNLTKKVNKTKARLSHGDEIHVVYRKAEPELNVAYLFQDMETLRREEMDSSSEQTLEMTQEYNNVDLDVTAENSDTLEQEVMTNSGTKRKSEDEEVYQEQNAAKKQKADPKKEAEKLSLVTSKEANPVGAGVSETVPSKPGDSKTSQLVETDAFEESLMCIICQEILHNCVSCQPCMHCFCAGCYSDWMSRSTECPSCRGEVERVNKNYIVNNLVDAYLVKHPEKKRPDDELAALDTRSKILKDTMRPPPPEKTVSELIDEDSDVDVEDESLSTSSDDDGSSNQPVVHTFGNPGLFGQPNLNIYRPPKTVCRQCPEYVDPGINIPPGTTALPGLVNKVIGLIKGGGTGEGTSKADGASTSGTAGDKPTMPLYTCPPTQMHILCQCCLKPMPDRRLESSTNMSVPRQQCTLCYRMYCHLYWGCELQNCDGCLIKVKDFKCGKQVLSTLILDNNYESDIFKNFLENQGTDLKDVIQTCLKKLADGTYNCVDQARGLTSEMVVCFSCGLRNMKDLMYQYRRDIPKEDLPAAVTARPDCYWGKNCRTQRGKIHHAANYNHICEQSRT